MKTINVWIAPAGKADVRAPINDPIRRPEAVNELSLGESAYGGSIVEGWPNCCRKDTITLTPLITPVWYPQRKPPKE